MRYGDLLPEAKLSCDELGKVRLNSEVVVA